MRIGYQGRLADMFDKMDCDRSEDNAREAAKLLGKPINFKKLQYHGMVYSSCQEIVLEVLRDLKVN